MSVVPKSLTGRLIAGGIVLIAVTMIAAGLLIGSILERFIVGQIDQRLDSTLNDLASQLSLGDDGTLKLAARGDGPDFMRPRSGWYWQVSDAKTVLHSPALDTALNVEAPRFDWRQLLSGMASPTRVVDADGMVLHGRIRTVTLGPEAVTIVATAPQMAIIGPLVEGLSALLLCLVALSLLLLAGLWLQVRVGLNPLRKLQGSVGEVANGRLERIPEGQPVELQPLAEEVNRLIKQNAERLELTRLQAANLAHSLKTPLATLSLSLAQDSGLAPLVARMEHSISHHLGRTRVAIRNGHQPKPLRVYERVKDIMVALEKIHSERGIRGTILCPPDLTVACDPSDFDEIAGNLLDNAFKWAQSAVAVSISKPSRFHMRIADDGPGLAEADIRQALQPGKRLDEKVPGDGFGLPIVVELVELYGGSLALQAQAHGRGLVATVELPGP